MNSANIPVPSCHDAPPSRVIQTPPHETPTTSEPGSVGSPAA